MYIVLFFFFCFKQNTAYEMRISDWSSDVCSSDLGSFLAARFRRFRAIHLVDRLPPWCHRLYCQQDAPRYRIGPSAVHDDGFLPFCCLHGYPMDDNPHGPRKSFRQKRGAFVELHLGAAATAWLEGVGEL